MFGVFDADMLAVLPCSISYKPQAPVDIGLPVRIGAWAVADDV